MCRLRGTYLQVDSARGAEPPGPPRPAVTARHSPPPLQADHPSNTRTPGPAPTSPSQRPEPTSSREPSRTPPPALANPAPSRPCKPTAPENHPQPTRHLRPPALSKPLPIPPSPATGFQRSPHSPRLTPALSESLPIPRSPATGFQRSPHSARLAPTLPDAPLGTPNPAFRNHNCGAVSALPARIPCLHPDAPSESLPIPHSLTRASGDPPTLRASRPRPSPTPSRKSPDPQPRAERRPHPRPPQSATAAVTPHETRPGWAGALGTRRSGGSPCDPVLCGCRSPGLPELR
jgi:hypothetical protein